MSTRYRARWVFPVDQPPIPGGTIEIEDGRIAALHGRFDSAAIDLGNVALLPGLVNAHTHLEFSDLTAPVEPALPFTSWIRALVQTRRARPDGAPSAIPHGLRECADAGTTLVGEIATADQPAADSAAGLPRAVVFRELLGLLPARREQQLAIAQAHLALPPDPNRLLGLSPHAPYSVHPDLYADLIRLAEFHRVPLAVHLAETEAELELLGSGTGEFVEMLQAYGVWDPAVIPRGSRPLDYLRPLAELRQALVIHGNYLAADEIDFLASHPQVAVVYCPRTHAYFGHAPHPWRRLLEQGASLALGTDSRGSNPDLSLWRELQFLHARFPDAPLSELLELGTQAGARALGLDDDTGTLTVGKRADVAWAELPDFEGDPHELLWRSAPTMWRYAG